ARHLGYNRCAAGEMLRLRRRGGTPIGSAMELATWAVGLGHRGECGPANKRYVLHSSKGVSTMTPLTAAWGALRRARRGPALAVAAVAGALAFAGTAAAQTTTLKMQSTWPASLTLQDNFKMFAERVEKLTGGTLKIEVHAAGQIVPPFEILDATSKKV